MSATTFDCNEIEELLPEYVLGTLDADELADIAQHLQDCPKHLPSLESYRDVGDALCMGVPQVDPPARLKMRLLASIAAPSRAPTRVRVSWVVAAVAAGVALLLGVWGVSLQNQVSELAETRQRLAAFVSKAQTRMVALNTTLVGETAKGVLFISDSDAAIWALGLPELQPGEVYQCWWFDAQKHRTSGGSFTTHSGATVWYMKLPHAAKDLQNITITREPNGESDEPQGPSVLSADF